MLLVMEQQEQEAADLAKVWPGLTVRESEIAEMMALGFANHEIAKRLNISVKTYDTHRGHLLKKLGIRDAVGLTRYAIRTGLVSGAEEADAPRSITGP